MQRFFKHIILLFLFNATYNYAQISPGDLTSSHAKFEGMSNCTLCHNLGAKVSNTKCLDCHKEIKTLISQKKGYHSSSEVKNKDCFKCHSEHHGRKFDMVRFDEKKFNHEITGYKLDGKHEVIDCKKCHVSDNIKNVEIKKRPNTFLGLDTKCASCHEDYHQKTLSSNNCASCHNTAKFKPAIKFDHNKADFKLKGKHETVDCNKCHEVIKKNGKDFQKFNNIPFADCKSCHTDPHNQQFKGTCTQCHTEDSFKVFKGRGKFNHNTTNFTLKGKHQSIDCFSCHAKTSNPKLVFQDKTGINQTNCVACHEDRHEGKLGNECSKCHKEDSFYSQNSLEFFDHNKTNFPLKGKHETVDCKKCHKERLTKKIEYTNCTSCHEDYHKGEFKKNNVLPDCKECHTTESGFKNSLFTLEKHEKTAFPLEGAHVATPCFACHVSEPEKRWTFKNKGTKCIDCHKDLHKTYIPETYYPVQNCKTCHSNKSWSAVKFDHNKTKWPLEGKHLDTDCRACHFKNKDKAGKYIQKFIKLESACVNCHESKHGDQFAINGVTDCVKCHILNSWVPEKFDHNTTAFKLEGKHTNVACNKCHIATIDKTSSRYNYKIPKHQCIDCHH